MFALIVCVLGILGLFSTLVLLGIQLAKKKKLKAVKIVPLVSAAVFALGVVLMIANGSVHIQTNKTDDTAGDSERTPFKVKLNSVLSFSSVDTDGNAVDSSIFKDSKVTMVNCWEPWCVHCKDEMPDLQKLYEKYGADGFNIIGVYADEPGLQEALDETGVSYPIILASDELKIFGNSRPTTVFVDSEGRVLEIPSKYSPKSKCALLGAQSYDGWEELILYYLGQ